MAQLRNRFHRGGGQRLLHGEPALRRGHGDDHGAARRQRLPDLVGQPAVYPMVGERARQRSRRGAHGGRGQQCRREQADRQARPGPPRGAPAAQAIAGVEQDGVAVAVLADEHRAPQRDVLGFGSLGEGFEVSASRIEILITGDDDQRAFFAHDRRLRPGPPCAGRNAVDVVKACGATPDAMGMSAGAMRLPDVVHRLGVEHHLGQLHQDQVDGDEAAQHGEELPAAAA